jgi:phage terminase large subunit-like protein
MASNNLTEDPPAAADTSNVTRRQRRGPRIAATVVACTLLSGIGLAVTASSASARDNDRCSSVTASYDDQVMYVADEFGVYTTDVLLEQWADAAVALHSYHDALADLQRTYNEKQAACL